jgi:hypothetical protein
MPLPTMNRSIEAGRARQSENVPSSRASPGRRGTGLSNARIAALGLPLAAVLLMLLSGFAAPVANPVSAHAPLAPRALSGASLGVSAGSVPAGGISAGIPSALLSELTGSLPMSSNGFPTAFALEHQMAVPASLLEQELRARSALLASPVPSAVPAVTGNPNNLIQSYAQAGSTIQVGSSNQSLANAGFDSADITNISTGSTFYQTHGFTGVSVSKNAGSSWVTNWPGQASAWSTSGNVNYGDVLGWPVLDPAYTGGVNGYTNDFLFGWQHEISPVLAATPSASNMYLLSPYAHYCFAYFDSTCGSTASVWNASWGVAVASSTNGGTTWANPVPIVGQPYFKELYEPACGTAAAGNYISNLNYEVNAADLAVDPSGNVYVAYSFWQLDYGTPAFQCNVTLGGYTLNAVGVTYGVSVTASSNSGATWSAAHAVALNTITLPTSSGLRYPYMDVHLAVGAGATPDVYVVYADPWNYTTSSQLAFAMADTANSGSTWTTAADLSIAADSMRASPGNWFFNDSAPILAIDNWSGSSYKGNMYLVWNDNRSATPPGNPSIAFSENTGTGWSSPVYLSPSTSALNFYDPTVSVDPSGGIWVAYYTANPSNGNYHLYGIYSGDGGASWSSEFVISTATSTPGHGASAIPIYGMPSIVGTSAGAYVSWEDCRATSCASGFDPSTYLALCEPASISSNAAGISANVTVGGATTSDPLPAKLGLVVYSNVTVGVPTWIPTPNGTYINEFASYSGAVSSGSNPVTFAYTGGNLVATYALVPGSWVAGTIGPAGLTGLAVSITDILNHEKVSPKLTSGASGAKFNATVPGGDTFNVTASATGYQTRYFQGSTTNFQTLTVDLTLPKLTGVIHGTISATTGTEGIDNATVLINGSALPKTAIDQTTGQYSATEPWGTYYVNITAPGYVGCNESLPTTLAPNGAAQVSCALEGAWVNGSVNIYPVKVWITPSGGAAQPITLTVNGGRASWTLAVPGGTYTILAHEPGYSTYNETYTVAAGVGIDKSISLTNRGLIEGQISPTSYQGNQPVFFVNNATQSTNNGAFNVSELASSTKYYISAELVGYKTNSTLVLVTPGNATWWNVNLSKLSSPPPPPNCNLTPLPAGCPQPKVNNQTPAGTNVLVYVGIGVIVLIVVIAAVLVLMRRGRGGGGTPVMAPPTSDPSLYGGSTMPGPESPPMAQDGTYPPPPPPSS